MTPALVEAAALYRFGLLASESGPAIAEQAILNGEQGETLPLLLVESDLTMSTIAPLLEACFAEARMDAMSDRVACYAAARFFAKQVVAGTLDPVAFGFQLLSFEHAASLPEELKEIIQNAMWHEEAPHEWGYPDDWKSYQAQRLEFLKVKASEIARTEPHEASIHRT
jgi:hypothetical protein